MSTSTVDYSALAAQNGAIGSMPTAARPPVQSRPGGPVDYNALAAQHGALDTGSTAAPAPSNLSTNEMLLTSLGGPWANDPRLSAQEKSDIATGRAAGALSVPAVATATGAATATPGAVAAGATALLPHVVKLGEWAEANPTQAKMLLEALKLTAGGAALIKWLKK